MTTSISSISDISVFHHKESFQAYLQCLLVVLLPILYSFIGFPSLSVLFFKHIHTLSGFSPCHLFWVCDPKASQVSCLAVGYSSFKWPICFIASSRISLSFAQNVYMQKSQTSPIQFKPVASQTPLKLSFPGMLENSTA